MFFYYCFTNKFGYDQVCRDEQQIGKPGDLIEANGSHFIALGETVSWKENYSIQHSAFSIQNGNIISSVLNSKTLELIHWMVYEYYTSYRAVLPMFLSDLGQYLKAKQKLKTLTVATAKKFAGPNSVDGAAELKRDSKLELTNHNRLKQSLIVFPDLLSLKYRFANTEYILTSQDTSSKIMKYYLDIQQGYKNILVTTGANITMDWKKLDQIICYFPKTRYYKAHQDPRVFVPDVLEKMAEIWKAKLVFIDIDEK